MDNAQIIPISETTIDQHGFFCFKSKPKSSGYQRKKSWLLQRFAEGLKIHLIGAAKSYAGFIEYIPAEYAWRVVNAPGYLVIHCIWVVGKNKKQQYGTRLLQTCLEDARQQDKNGVVMVSSREPWLADKALFLKNGFESVDSAPPSFDLLVYRLKDAPPPSFPNDWEARQQRFGEGLTLLCSDQCPYVEEVAQGVLETASQRGIPGKIVQLTSAQEVQQRSPSPYGVYHVLLNGKLVTNHWIGAKDLLARLDQELAAS